MNHCVCCMCILDLSDAIFLAVKGSFWSVKLTSKSVQKKITISFSEESNFSIVQSRNLHKEEVFFLPCELLPF